MVIGVSGKLSLRVPEDGDYCGWISVYWREEYDGIGNSSKIIVYKITTCHSFYAGNNAFNLDIYVDGYCIGTLSHTDFDVYSHESGSDAEVLIDGNSVYFASSDIAHDSDGNKSINIKLVSNCYVNSTNEWITWEAAEKTETVQLTKTHSHSYTKVVTPPTCTEDGFTTYTCSCGNSYIEDVVPATGHNHVAVVTPPTCTEQGYTTHACSCGDSYVDSYIDAPGHEYDEGVVTAKPVFNREGVRTRTCKICGETHAEAIPMLPSGAIIHNGAGFDTYHAYIHNGTKWRRYAPFMFNRNKWKRCWFGPDHPHEYKEPIIPDDPILPDIPSTPTQYLYGHEAEATVSYNGVVLPDIESVWDKSKYPYAVIIGELANEMVCFCTSELLSIGNNLVAKTSGTSAVYMLLGASEWQFMGEAGFAQYETLSVNANTVWSNHDILNTDGSVYLSASDPVKSYPDADVIIDGVGYKGAVLPELPEWDRTKYPYTRIYLSSSLGYMFSIFSAPFTVADDNLYILPVDEYPTYSYVTYYLADCEWTRAYYGSAKENSGLDGNAIANYSSTIWVDYNILYEDGTVALAATDPIPVGSPIGYSYNGTVLPELPETDLQYAVINVFTSDGVTYYSLCLSNSEPTTTVVGARFAECVLYECWGEDWEMKSEGESSGTLFFSTMLWSNADMTYSDSIGFTTSVPVPVYDKE